MFSEMPAEYTWYYKLYGRRLQHVPVALEVDGSMHEPLHSAWPYRFDGWWGTWDANKREIGALQFRENIRKAGVEYVIVTKPEGGNWPVYRALLDQTPDAKRVYQDAGSAIWRLD
jgi:hypothetical protein